MAVDFFRNQLFLLNLCRYLTAIEALDGGIGRRDWDRTSDHFHVKEVLYH
jgi:hypothetical protein